jgi:hypothetical protein
MILGLIDLIEKTFNRFNLTIFEINEGQNFFFGFTQFWPTGLKAKAKEVLKMD